MAKRVWPIEVRIECIRLRNKEGWSLQKIEAETGVPIRTVRHWCKTKSTGVTKQWSKSVVKRCMQLRQDGHSFQTITQITGVPDATVRGWLPKELRSFRTKKKPIVLSEYISTTRFKGLEYKLGKNDRLFYRTDLGEWVRSTLEPQDVGLAVMSQ